MKKAVTGTLVKYGVTCAIAGLMAFLVTQTYGLSAVQSRVERYRILCDAFTIPGVIFIMFGILLKIADCGALDGIAYAARSLYHVLIPMAGPKDESFWDYVQRKREARKGKNTSFILHVGILYMIPALIYMALFYKYYR